MHCERDAHQPETAPPARERTQPPTPLSRMPAGAVLALQRTAGNQAVGRALSGGRVPSELAAAFDADFSDVRVHTDSAAARDIGARAFAQGAELHFAPGEYRPSEAAGMELIAHELAHVVQQREGRAAPGVKLPAGGWADVSPALEAEAWQQARRAVDGRPARPGAAHSAPAATAPVIQGAFTVNATISSGGERDDRGSADLRIDEVQMTDKKRPPTRLGKSQGRHTVSWQAKTRYWAALLTGKTYAQAIATLTTLAAEDEAIDAVSGQADGARELRARLVATLQTLDTTKRMAESDWIETLTWAVTTYVKTYQLSTAAAFASVKPKGRGEGSHLAALDDIAVQLQEGEEPLRTVTERNASGGGSSRRSVPVTTSDAMAWARGLVDLYPGLPAAILHKVVKDWLAMLQTLYPKLFDADKPLLKKPTAEQVEAVKTKGYDQVLELFKVMGGESASTSEPPKSGKETEKGEGSEQDDEAGEDVESERQDTLLRETEPFLVRLATKHATAGTLFELDDLQVDRLVISDERPPTRFNNRQMSHTIPWSLERLAWAKAFTGTLEDVVEDFIKRVEEDEKWSSEPHTPRSVTEARAKLLTALKTDVGKRSIPEWTTWLNAAIERYVGAYQASPFAAYATEGTASGESTARSRGEAGNVRQMLAWEALLEELETPKTEHQGRGRARDRRVRRDRHEDRHRRDMLTAPKGAHVRKVVAQLIDIPELDQNREIVNLDTLRTRWIEELSAVFPRVVKAYQADILKAFEAEKVQSEHAGKLSVLVAEEGVKTRTKRSVDGGTKVTTLPTTRRRRNGGARPSRNRPSAASSAGPPVNAASGTRRAPDGERCRRYSSRVAAERQFVASLARSDDTELAAEGVARELGDLVPASQKFVCSSRSATSFGWGANDLRRGGRGESRGLRIVQRASVASEGAVLGKQQASREEGWCDGSLAARAAG